MNNIWNEVARIDSNNPKAIDKAIASLGRKGRKYALAVHAALVAAVEHSVKHSDASKVTMLWEALASYSNKRGIQNWIAEYTHLTLQKDAKGVTKFLGRHPETGEKSYVFLLAGADVAFFDMEKTKAQDEKAWDFVASAYALLDKAAKQEKAGKLNADGKVLLDAFRLVLKKKADDKKVVENMRLVSPAPAAAAA